MDDDNATALRYGRVVKRAPRAGREDVWWVPAVVLTGVIGVAGVIAAEGGVGRLQVAGLTAVTVAGFFARSRWPAMPSAVLAAWTFGPAIVLNVQQRGEGTMFLLVVALFFLVLETDDRRARMVAGAVAVLTPAIIQALRPSDWGWHFWMMGIGFGWLSGEQMRKLHDLATELAATQERLAEQAVHVERRRIAAELHDLVGHSLTVMLIGVTGARRLVRDDPDAAIEALTEAEAIGRASVGELRGSVRALRADGATAAGVSPMPAASDVSGLVERMVAAGLSVELAVTGAVDDIESVTGLVVYRVVQESLHNAARHAPGAPARVAMVVATDAVDVEVFDAGTEVSGHGTAGLGLIGMRERVEAVGGTLQVGPVAGGWQVRAHVPRALPGPT